MKYKILRRGMQTNCKKLFLDYSDKMSNFFVATELGISSVCKTNNSYLFLFKGFWRLVFIQIPKLFL